MKQYLSFLMPEEVMDRLKNGEIAHFIPSSNDILESYDIVYINGTLCKRIKDKIVIANYLTDLKEPSLYFEVNLKKKRKKK